MVGFGVDNAPFYSYETGELMGSYSDEATQLVQEKQQNYACLGSGAFSFNGILDGETPSQLSTQFTCDQSYMTGEDIITGGNGRYGCARGVAQLQFVSEGGLTVYVVWVCGDLCPVH